MTLEVMQSFACVAQKLHCAHDGDYSKFYLFRLATARARGMSQVARDARLSRENLYRALSGEGKP
jgi:probable addiction module antidote protein